jgi:hypothetical protein
LRVVAPHIPQLIDRSHREEATAGAVGLRSVLLQKGNACG